MRRKLQKTISNSYFVRKFAKAPSPKWVVFAVDLSIVILSTILTLNFNSDATAGNDSFLFSWPVKTVFVCAVYIVSMLLIRPYKSIVRLSTFEDSYRVALTVLTASAIILVLEIDFNITGTYRFVGIWNTFVLGVLTFAIMACVRLLIKYVYRMTVNDEDRRPVVVLGSSINSFALTQALIDEVDGRFNPVLMLSLGKQVNSNTTVNGIPIKEYDPDTVAELFNEYKSDTLLFMSEQIDIMRKDMADVFLSNHIQLLMLNQVENFEVNNDSATLSPHVQNIKIEDLLGREPIITDNPEIAVNLRDKTVLITGAAGSIGSEIVRQVASCRPGRLIMLDQAETPMHEMQLEMEKKFPDIHIKLCIADIANKSRITDIFQRYRPQYIYHAAAYKHVPMMENNPSEAVLTNIFGTKNLADLAMRFNAECFVMISTDKAVNPTNVMGASKRIAEIYVQSLASLNKSNDTHSTRFITTRFGNVLGSNGSVIPLFRKQIEEGGPVTVTHRDIIRYFMTIPEACSLVLEAGCMGDGGEIYIFDMGKPVKIYDLASRMISLAGLRPGKDIIIKETGLRPGEKLFEELLNDHERTIKTHHKKIMIAKVRTYDYDDVCRHLNDLHTQLDKNNWHDIVAEMKRIVPEFKSQNSEFTTIDSEISPDEVMHEL